MRAQRSRSRKAAILFIKAEAFEVRSVPLHVSWDCARPSRYLSDSGLRDYDALHHKRYGLPIRYHALSLMCDRFGICLFSLRFTRGRARFARVGWLGRELALLTWVD